MPRNPTHPTFYWLAFAAFLVSVSAVAAAPLPEDDEIFLPASPYEGPAYAEVLANDLDENGELLRIIQLVGVGANGDPACTLGWNRELSDGAFAGQILVFDVTHGTRPSASSGTTASCTFRYTAQNESGASATAILTVTSDNVLFADGFESGDTTEWN